MVIRNDADLLKPGETILNDQYQIERYIGSGGQGQVYLARHSIFGQQAIKRLHQRTAAQDLGRFQREIRITHELYQWHSENIIYIRNFEHDIARDEWFSIMEYANEGSLRDRLACKAPLPILESIKLAISLCRAVAYIHQYGYVHGDLKPGNILFLGDYIIPIDEILWIKVEGETLEEPIRE